MAQPYLMLFELLELPFEEVVKRIEPVLATGGYTFDGEIRMFERGTDGALYYCASTQNANTWSSGVAVRTEQKWPGAAFECRYLGYDVSVGIYEDAAGTTLCLDHDSVLYYELERDSDVFRDWLSMALLMVEALSCTLCILRKGGVKNAIGAVPTLDAIRGGSMQRDRDPLLAIVSAELLSLEQALVTATGRLHAFATTSGYTVITRLHPPD